MAAVGFVGIAALVVGDNLYRNWKESQQKEAPDRNVTSLEYARKADSCAHPQTNPIDEKKQ